MDNINVDSRLEEYKKLLNDLDAGKISEIKVTAIPVKTAIKIVVSK